MTTNNDKSNNKLKADIQYKVSIYGAVGVQWFCHYCWICTAAHNMELVFFFQAL